MFSQNLPMQIYKNASIGQINPAKVNMNGIRHNLKLVLSQEN